MPAALLPTEPASLPRQVVDALSRQIEDGTLELPVLAEAAQSVMQLALRDDVDVSALAETVKRDVALASHLLRVVNSPLYRAQSPIVSLRQAVTRLGMRQVRTIAVAIVCETQVFRVRGYETELKDLFRHSLSAGYFAQEIARAKGWNVEEAFLAGLLHDVGRPVLLQAVVDLTRQMNYPAPKRGALGLVGAAHARAGAHLVTRWELPVQLADAVHHHHNQTGPVSGSPLFSLVGLADELAHFALGTRPDEEAALRESPRIAAVDISETELDALLAARHDVVRSMEAVG